MSSVQQYALCRNDPIGRGGCVPRRPGRDLRRRLTQAVAFVGQWPPAGQHGHLGCVYNVLHHPHDGRTLLALYERNALAVLDYRSHRPAYVDAKAHSDSVNVATFLTDSVFASGCDAGECRVWDLRRPGSALAQLDTQAGSVKNLELLPSRRLLAASGFSSLVSFWDTRTLQPSAECPNWVTDDLMRMRVSPDADSLVLAYRSFLLVVRDFEPSRLRDDLPDFAPEELLAADSVAGDRRLFVEALGSGGHLVRRRNRLQLADAFGRAAEAEDLNLSSLSLHPSGQIVASRGYCSSSRQSWLSLLVAGPVPVSCYTYLHWLPAGQQPLLIGQFQEPIAARDIIKEINFSKCRRFLVSPFARGVRIFAGAGLDWLETEDLRQRLCVQPVATVLGTESSVVTSDFSPVYDLHVAVGTKAGVVHFAEPRL